MVSLNAHFDGKVIVPDEPLDLRPNQRVRIQIEAIDSGRESAAKPRRVFGRQPGAFTHVAPDFNEPLPDSFWLGEDEGK